MSSSPVVQPDYVALVRFLIAPFLEVPESLAIDCETYARDKNRVWVRVAFSGTDKGRVFGRNGRTLQAVRKVVETAGKLAGQSVSLEVHGEREAASSPKPSSRGGRPRPRRP